MAGLIKTLRKWLVQVLKDGDGGSMSEGAIPEQQRYGLHYLQISSL